MGFPNWDELYRSEPVEHLPWYLPGLDPDFDKALQANDLSAGRVLDLGTGPGTQAMALAERGFEVTASDISASAIRHAAEVAARRKLTVRFLKDDILRSKLVGPFAAVFDRGCMHVMTPAQRPRYVQTVTRLLDVGGLLFLKCFSDEEPGTQGPHRFRPEELRELFSTSFEVLSLERTELQGTLSSAPKSLMGVMRREV